MADIELVIKIPEEVYKDGTFLDYFHVMSGELVETIYNGIQLPKGHGRLIDANYFREDSSIFKIIPFAQNMNLQCVVDHAPTIIEADKGE